jgi:hypothetical protein
LTDCFRVAELHIRNRKATSGLFEVAHERRETSVQLPIDQLENCTSACSI